MFPLTNKANPSRARFNSARNPSAGRRLRVWQGVWFKHQGSNEASVRGKAAGPAESAGGVG
jgi:hypothetical protein